MTRLLPTFSERKRNIVHQIASQCDVEPDMIEDAYPCLPFQADLFKASTQGAGILHYNFIFRLRDTTPQVVQRICEVFKDVHCRNPILRSRIIRYTNPSEGASQVAQALVKQDFKLLEFDDLDQYCLERTGHCLRYGEELVQYGLSRDRNHLVWTIHHTIYDGWSIGLLWRELCDTMSAGSHRPTTTRRPKYVKFIAHLQKPMATADKQFWTKHLADYTGPRLRHYELVSETDARRHGNLNLADVHQSSINITARIQAAWFCTLVELYGNLDVMTLIVATGRNSQVAGIADMTGPCICVVPFRKRVNLTMPLYQFMLDVEQCSSELLAHEHTGLESMQTLIEEAQHPVHTFNVKSGLDGEFKGFRGLDYQPAQNFRNSRDWLVGISIGEETVSWKLCFDSNRLGHDAVELICERFPTLLQACLTSESCGSAVLKDVIDARRLSRDL